MTPINLISLLFGLAATVFGFVVYAKVGGTVSAAMSGIAADFAEIERDAADRDAGEMTVENAPGGVLKVVKEAGARSPRDEILALVNPEVLSRERKIELEIVVDPADLLSDGESLPEDPDLAALTVKVRGRAVAHDLCGELVKGFAGSCIPQREEAQAEKDFGGL